MPTKTKSKTSKRTLIEPHKGDRRYVRRNAKGQSKTSSTSAAPSPPTGAAPQRPKPSQARAIAAT